MCVVIDINKRNAAHEYRHYLEWCTCIGKHTTPQNCEYKEPKSKTKLLDSSVETTNQSLNEYHLITIRLT